MATLLTSAQTWFYESAVQQLDGSLVVRLVEGLKGADRQPVVVGTSELGPYFPVAVQAASRVVEVAFPDLFAFFTYNERFDGLDPELEGENSKFLFRVTRSSFRTFALKRTSLATVGAEAIQEYVLWCEDWVFQVLCGGQPSVKLVPERPDLDLERTTTWSAS